MACHAHRRTSQAVAVNTAFAQLNNAASGDISGASADLTSLAAGAAQVSTGVQGLNTGISTASSGASALDSGLGTLSTGATTLDTGIGTLQLGAQKLDDGLGTAGDRLGDPGHRHHRASIPGPTNSPTDLTAGAARIPTLAPDQEANAEQVLSSPADVQVTIDNPADGLRARARAVLLRHRDLGVRHLGVPGDAADLRSGAGRPGVLGPDLHRRLAAGRSAWRASGR